MIKPLSSFNASLSASFPALKALFHADDFTSGALTWASRVGGLTITMTGALTKDSAGVYTAATNTISSVTGTMPTLAKYAAVVAVGRLQTSSAVAGVTAFFGKSDSSSGGISSAGFAVTLANSGIVNTTPTLTGTITAGSKAASVGYFDLVDTTSPDIFRVLGGVGGQVISNGAGTTDLTSPANGAITLGTLGQAMTCSALTTADNAARMKVIALFDFSSAMVIGDVQLAAAEMARTQELYAGWRNRAAA